MGALALVFKLKNVKVFKFAGQKVLALDFLDPGGCEFKLGPGADLNQGLLLDEPGESSR